MAVRISLEFRFTEICLLCEIFYKLNSMFVSRYSNVKEIFSCRNIYVSLYSTMHLEYVACLLHCELGELGSHPVQVPYPHAFWRVQL